MNRKTPACHFSVAVSDSFSGAGRRRRDADFLRELEVLLGVAARQQRQRRVVEIGQVVGLPVDEAGRRRERQALSFVPGEERRRVDVAIGVPLEVARRRDTGCARSAARSLKRVVAVARALAGVDEARFPVRPPASSSSCALPKVASREVEVVAGDVVGREAVALRVADREADRRLLPDRARRRSRARRTREVAERHDRLAGPLGQATAGRC